MLVTFELSKLDKSADVNLWHKAKISSISTIFLVLKFDTFIDVNDVQYLNIELIVVTEDVSKFDRSSEANL
jgi:hypothetical protein